MKLFAAAACCLALASCATTQVQPKTPAQALYVVTGDYAAALTIAVRYRELPTCVEGGPVLCSKPEIVGKLVTLDARAWGAIDAAQGAVRSLLPANTQEAYVENARRDVADFSQLTRTIP